MSINYFGMLMSTLIYVRQLSNILVRILVRILDFGVNDGARENTGFLYKNDPRAYDHTLLWYLMSTLIHEPKSNKILVHGAFS
jgi:hypothetical protein